jgi:hypothetical protein
MDKVRFGRALGYGARHAGKSLLDALDAATSPDPKGAGKPGGPVPAAVAARAAAGAKPSQARRAGQAVNAGRQASRSVLGPVKKATSVVWLQMTGSFFGLLAFGMGGNAWKLRANLRTEAFSRPWITFWIVAALAAGLAYFAVSNFVRARRRDRR